MDDLMAWSREEEEAFLARRRRRNIVIGIVLGAMVVLFYAITVGRMST